MSLSDRLLPHKSGHKVRPFNLIGGKALIVTTSQATLDKINPTTREVLKVGKATGVYASEMTEPYYVFKDAGLEVDIASIKGGKIPIEKLSLRPFVRTKFDGRFLKDNELKEKVKNSFAIANVDIENYDIIFLSGGWGAAYDFAQSEVLTQKITEAYGNKKVLGGVCHGPLGFIGAKKPDGSDLVAGVRMTGVTNKQLKQLMVGRTPIHPETELKKAKAVYKSKNGLINMFSNHIEVDEEHLIVTGQNQKAGIEAAEQTLILFEKQMRSNQ